MYAVRRSLLQMPQMRQMPLAPPPPLYCPLSRPEWLPSCQFRIRWGYPQRFARPHPHRPRHPPHSPRSVAHSVLPPLPTPSPQESPQTPPMPQMPQMPQMPSSSLVPFRTLGYPGIASAFPPINDGLPHLPHLPHCPHVPHCLPRPHHLAIGHLFPSCRSAVGTDCGLCRYRIGYRNEAAAVTCGYAESPSCSCHHVLRCAESPSCSCHHVLW